jgi:hypothetical protein
MSAPDEQFDGTEARPADPLMGLFQSPEEPERFEVPPSTPEHDPEAHWFGTDVGLDGSMPKPCGCIGREIVCEQHRQVQPRRRWR